MRGSILQPEGSPAGPHGRRPAPWLPAALSGLAALSILPAWTSAAAPRDAPAIVRLTDSTEVRGSLLEISPEGVRLDPDGPVSLRVLTASEVAWVQVLSEGATYAFPLEEGADLRRLQRELDRARARRDPARLEASGFRILGLTLGGGVTRTSAGEEISYYEGYDSGGTLRGGARLFLPRDDERAARPFLGLGYSRSKLSADVPQVSVQDGAGNTLTLRFGDLTVSRWILEAGFTTSTLGRDSYVYGVAGLSFMTNEGGAEAVLSPAGGSAQSVSVEVEQGRTGLRLGLGAVVGLAARFGLELDGNMDLLLGKPEEIPGYDQTVPSYEGALLGVTAGLTFEL